METVTATNRADEFGPTVERPVETARCIPRRAAKELSTKSVSQDVSWLPFGELC